jgi:hypothetical protein
MATLAFALLELGTIGCPAGVGREDLILAARVAADEAFEFLMRSRRSGDFLPRPVLCQITDFVVA